MTSYLWAQLPAGTYGLSGPAVVLSPWVLEVRADPPELFGFTRVTAPEQWSQVGTARLVVADFPESWDMLLISAERPDDVDPVGLRDRRPGAADAGDVHWCIPGLFRGSAVQAFHDQAGTAGRVLVLTGDLRAYWSKAATADAGGDAVTFPELFPSGAWAAWVPLLARLYDDGVGTRPG